MANQLLSVFPHAGVVISVLLCSHYIKPTATQSCVKTTKAYKPRNAQHALQLTNKILAACLNLLIAVLLFAFCRYWNWRTVKNNFEWNAAHRERIVPPGAYSPTVVKGKGTFLDFKFTYRSYVLLFKKWKCETSQCIYGKRCLTKMNTKTDFFFLQQ